MQVTLSFRYTTGVGMLVFLYSASQIERIVNLRQTSISNWKMNYWY